MNKIVDAMQVEEFVEGDCITRSVERKINLILNYSFRQGSYGETFYIILDGEVSVSQKQVGFIRRLSGGEYFGEMALLNEASIR